jgi:hypothetical protein
MKSKSVRRSDIKRAWRRCDVHAGFCCEGAKRENLVDLDVDGIVGLNVSYIIRK